ncbi:MAG: site-specific DNA-methyltransferase [Chitinophagaceae bacterium]|nr:site-specific DNA-methyltransferase [Chitinophagaceae bacterium]
MKVAYKTTYGKALHGHFQELGSLKKYASLKGSINLIFTSPPFALNRKKKYGNYTGKEYLDWIASLAPLLADLLSEDGSLVVEIGNAWTSGEPEMSTLPIESLLALKKAGGFKLCQQFVWFNPAKLPSPAQWVNVERVRVKDSFTNIWWMSRSAHPKANNRNVLDDYSKSMKKLLASGKYNHGRRPSQHNIGERSFLSDNHGSIPSNVLIASNTSSNDRYTRYCKDNGIEIHPARMPLDIPEFFIKFLTNESDLVLDPFSGSNSTGYAAEKLGRKWLSVECNELYLAGSVGRFDKVSHRNSTPYV